jgi:hypothetical protein
VVRGAAELQRGRESYAGRRWIDAYESLAVADRASPLRAEDLELLARSAYMLGRDDDYLRGLERAHGRHLESGQVLPAVRCAWWIGHNLLFRGATAPARDWFARAQRLLERERGDCVEAGYLLIPVSSSTPSAVTTSPRMRPPWRSRRRERDSPTATWRPSA